MTILFQPELEAPVTDLASECREVPTPELLPPTPEILQAGDKDKHAASLGDQELLAHVRTTLHSLRDNLPYLREARDRFAQPGRRVPDEGNPTWTEWVTANLNKSVRTVQRWLEGPKPKKEKKARPIKPLKDWQDAMRRANDLVAAVKRLNSTVPKGASLLWDPIRQLADITSCPLVEIEPTTEHDYRLDLTVVPPVTKIPPHVDAPPNDEETPDSIEANTGPDRVAAEHGWVIGEDGRSSYEGRQVSAD